MHNTHTCTQDNNETSRVWSKIAVCGGRDNSQNWTEDWGIGREAVQKNRIGSTTPI